MYSPPFVLALLFSASVSATNIVLSNDDGWAELNIRTFFDALLRTSTNSVVLSAPSENKSGTGSSDAAPTVLTTTCEFDTCPVGSPAEGFNSSDTRLNYVNSFPVTSMRFGIQTLSPNFFSGPPDIAVAGPNVGSNLGTTTLISGTVGAATEAALEGIPAIAFSGATGSQISYTSSTTSSSNLYSTIYATLAANITNFLIQSSGGEQPFLNTGIWLNVNFPASSTSRCSEPALFKFVLSRINTATSSTAPDVSTCGSSRLPAESSVVGTTSGGGCFVSVSVGNATTKGDVSANSQEIVLGRLSGLLSCLPS